MYNYLEFEYFIKVIMRLLSFVVDIMGGTQRKTIVFLVKEKVVTHL